MLVLLLFEELLGINELQGKYTPASVKRNAQKTVNWGALRHRECAPLA